MSPDEIFASQMWNWPDPMLKRDAYGRIMFVNAAFLNMYGGNVANWQGNVVGGWPAPVPGPTPIRFETRMPQHDVNGQPIERVYDWMEYVLADGNALGFARDVTNLLMPNDVPPGGNAHPQHPQTPPTNVPSQSVPSAASAPLAVHATGHNPAPKHDAMPTRDWEKAIEAPYLDPAAQGQDYEAHISAEAAAPIASQTIETPYENAVHPAEPAAHTTEATATDSEPQFTPPEPAPEHAPAIEDVHSAAPVEPVVATPPAKPINAPPVRDHERRALPIENGDAVLGANWRDAVIAKAVGAGLQREDAAQAQEPETSLRKPTKPPKEALAAAPAQSKSDLRILLAEDNAINALLTRTLLESEGCTVDVVEDGALAVEAVKNATYDMIFMDMRMPNMDGLESTRKIRSLSNVPSDMPIVALTANAFDDDRNACFDSGMNDFMTKPVSAEELSEMVERWAMRSLEQKMAS